MQTNDLIGIAGVFILTFLLLLVYHLMSKLGRPDKRYGVQSERGKDESDRGSHRDLHRSSRRNDNWLLSSQGRHSDAGAAPRADEPRTMNTPKTKRRVTLR